MLPMFPQAKVVLKPIVLNTILGRAATRNDVDGIRTVNMILACNRTSNLPAASERLTPTLRFLRDCCTPGRRELQNGATVKKIGSNRIGIICPHCHKSITHFVSTHGKYNTPEYRSWFGMKSRCLNPRNYGFRNYGGRGITVCKKWMEFEGFIEDMGLKPSPEYSLESFQLSLEQQAGPKQQQENNQIIVP